MAFVWKVQGFGIPGFVCLATVREGDTEHGSRQELGIESCRGWGFVLRSPTGTLSRYPGTAQVVYRGRVSRMNATGNEIHSRCAGCGPL